MCGVHFSASRAAPVTASPDSATIVSVPDDESSIAPPYGGQEGTSAGMYLHAASVAELSGKC